MVYNHDEPTHHAHSGETRMNPTDIVTCEPLHARIPASSCVGRYCAAQSGCQTVVKMFACVKCPVGAARAEALGVVVLIAPPRHTHVAGLTAETGFCARCRGTYRADLAKSIAEPLRVFCPCCRTQSKKQAGGETTARALWLTTTPRLRRGTPSGRSQLASQPPVSGR